MPTIADVHASLVLDDKAARKTLESDLPAAADRAGTSAGSRFSSRMGTAVKATIGGVIGGALAGTFAIASKGAAELNSAMATFAANTGATQAEITSAQGTISEMYKSNLQGFESIGGALGALRTDLGLTQDEANATVESFLKFATATGQDATGAVVAFDDILDAWNLTATDAQGIMDKLVVSHQKYGGSIEGNQGALASLAPALQAAGMTIDDGIGLLNLFASSGVDAAAATTGMQKALTKVKSPDELKALLADITATEDPFLRAQKAADLFGARAGAKLAQALSKGNIEDFTVSLEEAAGASDKAAAAIEGSFGNQIQLKLKEFGGTLAEVGSNFGPLILGFSALLPALTPVVTAAGAALGGLLAAAIPVGMALLPVLLVGAIVAAVAFLVMNPEIVGEIANFVGSILTSIIEFLVPLPGMLLDVFGNALNAVVQAIPPLIVAIAIEILKLPLRILDLQVKLLEFFAGIGTNILGGIAQLIANIVGFFVKLPGRIATMGPKVVGQFVTMAALAGKVVLEFVGKAVGFLLGLPGKIAGLLVSIPGMFASLATTLLGKVASLVGGIVAFFLGIPGRIASLGGRIVSGIISGMASLPGKLANAVANAFRNLRIDIGPFHISGSGISIDLPKLELPSFAVGSSFVPQDMLAAVHQGEIIVPATAAAGIRSGDLTLGRAEAASGGPGGNTYNIVVNAGSDVSVTAARRFGQAVADEMAATLREQRARSTGTV